MNPLSVAAANKKKLTASHQMIGIPLGKHIWEKILSFLALS